ncbi:MAG: VanW family protein [Syntrophomonadaceae bacterium]|jgi:vancomycin resistance protein YoaR|nr:VanW family protein [Syntrophomonadaceae bacterium]MDH7497813.1 VanW family protein [Syntrophomonadaceae bacterium]
MVGRAGGRRVRRGLAAVTVAIVVLVLAGTAYGLSQYQAGRFPAGVWLGPVAVGGMDGASAAQAIRNWAQGQAGECVLLAHEEGQLALDLQEAGVGLEVEAAVRSALAEVYEGVPWWQVDFWLHPRPVGGAHFDIPLRYGREQFARALARLRPVLEEPPRDARVEFVPGRGVVANAERPGRTIDVAATLRSAPLVLSGPQLVISVATAAVEPTLRQRDFAELVLLGGFSTSYRTSSADRAANVETAAAALDGATLAPGQEFSFNHTVGPRVASAGYLPANVIQNNEFVLGVGGGVCQVSSTLYNAVLLAGLEIVERHNHSVLVSYVPSGRDATVNYGRQDLRFRNNTGGPLYVRTVTADRTLTVEVYGPATALRRVEIERQVERTIPFPVVRRSDPTLPAGRETVKQKGVPGQVVHTWRVFLDDSGREVAREDLGRSSYNPMPKIILEGPPLPAPAPAGPAAVEAEPAQEGTPAAPAVSATGTEGQVQ